MIHSWGCFCGPSVAVNTKPANPNNDQLNTKHFHLTFLTVTVIALIFTALDAVMGVSASATAINHLNMVLLERYNIRGLSMSKWHHYECEFSPCKNYPSAHRVLGYHILPPVSHLQKLQDSAVAHAPSAMVLFFLFLFLPLTFVLTAIAMLCKPGCAVSAADTSSV